MKKCIKCGAVVDDSVNFCGSCGSPNFTSTDTSFGQTTVLTNEPMSNFSQGYQPVVQPQVNPVNYAVPAGNGNVFFGIIGALLFSLAGGALYFAIYQAGVIAGFCGLVIFLLANLGYRIFARTKNKNSIAGLVVSIIVTIVMIFASEFFCVSYEIYDSFKSVGATLFEAIEATPEFLEEPELSEAFVEDLVFAYVFGFIASLGNIISIVKSRKNQ